ncbi:carboxypeptidase-like regulatory domain-containing protein [candidate division WOR-3 bacterium]|nr:carboxypeptidase-like regulatory domain-containing protein [candidate division WOR-3 bacterium]
MNLILLASLMFSLPQGNGFFHIRSPYTTPRKYLGVDFLVTGSSSPYDALKRIHTYLSSDLVLSYGISDYFEVFASPKMYTKISAPSEGESRIYTAFGVSYIETGFGIHIPFQINRSQLGIGFRPSVTFCIDTTSLSIGIEPKLTEMGFDPLPYHNPDYNFKFFGEYRFGRFSSLLNLGYTIRGESRRPLERRKSGFDFGIGMKFDLTSLLTLGTAIIGKQNGEEIFIAPQISLRGFFGMLQIESHIPISNFDFIPDKKIHRAPAFGIRYKKNLKAFRDLPPWVVQIAGEVVDSISGEPLYADVELFGPVHRWSKSDETTGGFAFPLPSSGTYRISVSKEGYHSLTKVVRLMKLDSLFSRFALERIVDISISGRIFDAATGDPIAAAITLIGDEVYQTVSDSITGRYKLWAKTGIYTLVVEKRGYKKKVIPVFITGETTINMDVEMVVPERRRFLWW